jgi:carboxymethylenebutenolidase
MIVETVTVSGPRGSTSALCFTSSEFTSRRPAVAIGAEATGINDFIRAIAKQLVAEGFVVAVADYYRGNGPADPNSYEDIEELKRSIGQLDFTDAIADQLATVDYLRSREDVDADRVSTWGYCTGATLSWAAAALDRRLASAVIYYPSQPTFPALDARHPVQVMDLVRTQSVPTLFLVGGDDDVMTEDKRNELTYRMNESIGTHEMVVYPGAKHVFAGWMPGRRRDEAAADAWKRAVAWLGDN